MEWVMLNELYSDPDLYSAQEAEDAAMAREEEQAMLDLEQMHLSDEEIDAMVDWDAATR
jgi:hypothetical protein